MTLDFPYVAGGSSYEASQAGQYRVVYDLASAIIERRRSAGVSAPVTSAGRDLDMFSNSARV